MTQKIILTIGAPASGKSTWAKKFIVENAGWKRVNKDDLRAMIDNSVWSKSNESIIVAVRDGMVRTFLKNGFSVIVDDTNTSPSHLEAMKSIAQEFPERKIDVEVKWFTDVPMDELIRRDSERPNKVGETVIRRIHRQLPRREFKPLEQDNTLVHAIIVDMDGTLALLNGRDPFDASSCIEDKLSLPVAQVLRNYSLRNLSDTKVIIVSGREDKYETQTRTWLEYKDIPYDHLFMRKTGDQRNDAIVKSEIFDANIAGKFFIDFAIDDRKRVKRMWVDKGIFVFDVNLFDEEF